MRLTSSNDVVDDKHLLSRLDRSLLHLEEIGSVFFLVAGRHAGAGHLALLPHGHEAGVQTQGQRGAKEEAPRIQPHYHVGLAGGAELEHLEFEGAEQGIVDDGVLEQGQNVDEVDAGDGEVGEALEGAEEAYLCTGEFGGGGGGGGGLSSRGILSRGGGSCSGGGGGGEGGGDWVIWAGRRRQSLGRVGG